MLLQVQPPHVREEKAAHGIVRVGFGLGILVMDAMIARPVVDRTLIGDGVAQHEEETNGEGGAVGAVGPEAMDTDGNAESTERRGRDTIAMRRCLSSLIRRQTITRLILPPPPPPPKNINSPDRP
jgi:hypothetical protein